MEGVVIPLVLVLFAKFGPQPVGPIVLFGVAAVHCGLGCRAAWRSLGPSFLCGGYAIVGLASAIVTAIEVGGVSLRSLSIQWHALALLVLGGGVLLFHLESRAHPHRMALWRKHWQFAGVVNRLTFRQAPDLRDVQPGM